MIRCYDSPLLGTLVKSVAGRDRKRVFIVIGTTDEGHTSRLLVTDGSLRSCQSPKAKNPRHVRPIGKLTDNEISRMMTDMSDTVVREILSKYDRAICCKQND